jgi:hypothetical protein
VEWGNLDYTPPRDVDEQDAKGTTNVYQRVQGRSRARSSDQRQEYQKGSPETWALETVRCITGANTWQSRVTRPFLAVGIKPRRHEEIRRLKRELEVTRQERDILKKVLHIYSRDVR